MYSFSYISR